MLDWSWHPYPWSFFPWPLPMILRKCGMWRWANRIQRRLQRKASAATLKWYRFGFEIHRWKKTKQCLRNEKLPAVAVGFTLEGCIEAQLSNASFWCFLRSVFCCCSRILSESFLHLENCVECPKYMWQGINLSTRQLSRRSATEFYEA